MQLPDISNMTLKCLKPRSHPWEMTENDQPQCPRQNHSPSIYLVNLEWPVKSLVWIQCPSGVVLLYLARFFAAIHQPVGKDNWCRQIWFMLFDLDFKDIMFETYGNLISLLSMGTRRDNVIRSICNLDTSKTFIDLHTKSDWSFVNAWASIPNAQEATDSIVNLEHNCKTISVIL